WLTLWLHSLSPEADPGNVVVTISGIPHTPHAVDVETGQVNIQLRPLIEAGMHEVTASHRGADSAPMIIEVLGRPPAVQGLEILTRGL
ncbi:MAG: hypothetical protein ABI995_07765, partial [Acidobacteriota bacterium]